MSKPKIAILIALTAVATLALSESVRRAVAQAPSSACEDELADYQDEVSECLAKAATLQQARACSEI